MKTQAQVNITRRFYCKVDKLWGAISEGHLFFFTGAIKDKSRFEFKPNGKIHLEWNDGGTPSSMDGMFTIITPQTNISFSWTNVTDSVSNSTVDLTIRESNEYCELSLVHTFSEGTATRDYDFGWDDAMFDLKKHIYKN